MKERVERLAVQHAVSTRPHCRPATFEKLFSPYPIHNRRGRASGHALTPTSAHQHNHSSPSQIWRRNTNVPHWIAWLTATTCRVSTNTSKGHWGGDFLFLPLTYSITMTANQCPMSSWPQRNKLSIWQFQFQSHSLVYRLSRITNTI